MRSIREWWLPQAERLPVGGSIRVIHPADMGARASVLIRNAPGEYSVWCFRRNAGDYVPKQHVIPEVAPVPTSSEPPPDVVKLQDAARHAQEACVSFLVKRGVTPSMFPENVLGWSTEARRLMFDYQGILLGRDISASPQIKWVDYSHNPEAVWHVGDSARVVLVEDVLSAHKVAYCTGWGSIAVRGTRLSNAILLRLLKAEQVVLMPDGDTAGWMAARAWSRDLRGLGIKAREIHLGRDLDPKNLQSRELRAMIRGN